MRQHGKIRYAAILIASGVGRAGKRSLVGVSASLSEQEIHWRTFLQSLVARGLGGVHLIIGDYHSSLKAAHLAVFGEFPGRTASFTWK